MGGNQFRKAKKLFNHKKYSKVIQMLEPQVFRFRESFTFFYLLGMSCLWIGDVGGAYSYLNRARNINPDNIDTLLGLAALFLKKQDTQKALSTWFLVLDKDPKNKTAQKGLKLLRKYTDVSDLVDLVESTQFYKIIPAPSAAGTILTRGIIIFISLILAAGAGYGIYRYLPALTTHRPQREGVQTLTIQSAAVSDNNKGTYFFSKKELQKEMQKIKDYFNNFDDNEAMLEINRVLLSNAEPSVKKEVLILRGYLKPPTFSTLKTAYSYKDVVKEPLLYEGCYVLWKGRLSNIVTKDDYISFDLLVGYEKEKILQGIVPVKLDFPVRLDPALAIEILGEIHIVKTKILLSGISVHQFQ